MTDDAKRLIENCRCNKEISLSLYDAEITDLSVIADLTHLKELYLIRSQIKDITPLSQFTSLTLLYLVDNRITDLTPLSTLFSLTELYLDNNCITDLTPLSNLSNLTNLSIGNEFKITNKNQFNDFLPLSKLINLDSLGLYNIQITDISFLKVLANLKYLWMNNDVSFINHNPIKDITLLSKLTNLERLYLDGNEITNISPLSELINLISLSLSRNQIKDITPLSKLKALQFLDISDNFITHIEPLMHLLRKQEIYINFYDEQQQNDYDKGIILRDNPLEKTLIGAINQGNRAVIAYYKKLQIQESEPLNLNKEENIISPVQVFINNKIENQPIMIQEKNNQNQLQGNDNVAIYGYLSAFVIIFGVLFAALNILNIYKSLLLIVGGVLCLTIIGALQLRNDDRLNEENFIGLMGIVLKKIPPLSWFNQKKK